MSEKRSFRFGGGITSVLMVLIVLMLSSFAALSYMTASAEEKLAARAEAASADYYAANAKLEAALFASASALADHPADPLSALSQIEGAEVLLDGGKVTLTFTYPVDENRQLRAVYQVAGSAELSLLSRAIESTAEWEEEILDIWDGT